MIDKFIGFAYLSLGGLVAIIGFIMVLWPLWITLAAIKFLMG